MMLPTKPLLALLCCFSMLCARATAQGPADDPLDGTVVDCHGEKAIIFGQTESRDGRYALGWAIRPKRASAKPVDWSDYKKDDLVTWLDGYSVPADEDEPSDYELVNGVVDLTDRKFTVLATKSPYFPSAHHQSQQVVWSDDRPGPQYAVVVNDGRWNTANLWLVAFDAEGVHANDLRAAADRAVVAAINKRNPKHHWTYATAYLAGGQTSEGKTLSPFEGKKLRIFLNSGVPHSTEAPSYSGSVVAGLPKGEIQGVKIESAE